MIHRLGQYLEFITLKQGLAILIVGNLATEAVSSFSRWLIALAF